MEPLGILNACTMKVRMNRASSRAMQIAWMFSQRAEPFWLVLVVRTFGCLIEWWEKKLCIPNLNSTLEQVLTEKVNMKNYYISGRCLQNSEFGREQKVLLSVLLGKNKKPLSLLDKMSSVQVITYQ